ncbi:lipoprotein NlpI precursor [mine drainage metagenome]|uniref:Lipoprotein NlpI n=1 Tax=mine drainage metagenome TaxID=410659 RepID=A0A1J5RKF1_9ZZZZ
MNSSTELLKVALDRHLHGRLPEACELYRRVLAIDPRQPQALSMLGILLMNTPGRAEAESLFLRHLAVVPEDPFTLHNLGRLNHAKGEYGTAVDLFRRAAVVKPDLAPIFNDLAVSLNCLGQRDEALAAVDRALQIDPHYGVAHDNRGIVLYDCHRFAEAIAAQRTALERIPPDARPEQRISILFHLSLSAYEATDLVIAEQACRAILELNADHDEAIVQLGKILLRLRRDVEALALLNQLARRQGLIREGNAEHPEATILLLGGVGASHVPTRYLFDMDSFDTRSLTLLTPDQPDAPLAGVSLEALAEADLVFNLLGEVEKAGGHLETVAAQVLRLGKPVLNPPERVMRTGRDSAPELFGDIPGLLVPGVRRLARDERPEPFAAPFLIRPGGAHGGEDLALIETPADLSAYLDRVPHERFLLTDFHDFKGDRGAYRKYRFIFVDREPHPYHLAIAENWLVHYWRADMGQAQWKRQEEEAFLTDWRQVFGAGAAAVVEQVARRLDLDYGGMDCSLLADGRVLFFEANACMLVHLDDAEAQFPYKFRAVPLIREAVTRMIRSRISRS